MAADMYLAVRQMLEAEDWHVGEIKRRVFEAQRAGEHLTGVICKQAHESSIAGAYERLLALQPDGDQRRVAVVVTPKVMKVLETLTMSPQNRMKVAVLVVYDNAQVFEIPAENIAAADLPNGPAGWRNWRAANIGMKARAREEHAFYSDSGFLAEISALGPVEVINTVSRVGPAAVGDAQQVLVMRVVWHMPRLSLLSGASPPTTQTDAYYEGWVGDEFAALLSLALGIRCMDGGPIRVWWDEDDLDGLGRPMTFYHRRPALEAPQYGEPMLPRVARDQVDLRHAQDLLELYGQLEANRAVAVVRAARQFQQALWYADQSPGLAWLLLVGALETAANLEATERPGLDTLLEMRPEWAEVLGKSTSAKKKKEKVIKEIAMLSLSTAKVQRLVTENLPDAPPHRAEAPHAIDWEQLVKLVKRIYGQRSGAVHAGVPMPAPLLTSPMPKLNPLPERPGATIGSGDSVWTSDDMPMYLHTFATVVGGVLRNWWRALANG